MVLHQACIAVDNRSRVQPFTPPRNYTGILRHDGNRPMPPSPASQYVNDLKPRKETELMMPHTDNENCERMGVTTVNHSTIDHRMDTCDYDPEVTAPTVDVSESVATPPPSQPCYSKKQSYTSTPTHLLNPSTFSDSAQRLHLNISTLSEQTDDIGYFCDVTRWAYNSTKIQKFLQRQSRQQKVDHAHHDVQAIYQTQQSDLVRELIVPLRIHQLKQAFVGFEDSSAQQHVFPVPVRTLMIRVRPDQATAAVMSVVKTAIEQTRSRSEVFKCEPNLCQAVVVDRHEGDRGAFLLDAQLCVARTFKLERVLMLRLYHCHSSENKQRRDDDSNIGDIYDAGASSVDISGSASSASTGSTDSTGSTTFTPTRNAADIGNTDNAPWLDQLFNASALLQQAGKASCEDSELPLLSESGSALYATSQRCINSILRRLVLTEMTYHTDTKWKYRDQEAPLELDVDYLAQASEIMGRSMRTGHYFSILAQELQADIESMKASLEDFVSLTKPAMMRYKMNMTKYVARMPPMPASLFPCADGELVDDEDDEGLYQDLDVYSLASFVGVAEDCHDADADEHFSGDGHGHCGRDNDQHDNRVAAFVSIPAADYWDYNEDECYARDNFHRTILAVLDYGVEIKKYQRCLVRQISKSVSLQAELAAAIAGKLIDHASLKGDASVASARNGLDNRHSTVLKIDRNCHRSSKSAFRKVKQVPLLRVMLNIRRTVHHLDHDGVGIDSTATPPKSSEQKTVTSSSDFPYCMIVTNQLLLCSISASETMLFDMAQVSFAVSSLRVLTVRDGKTSWNLSLECIDAPRLCRFFRSLQALLGGKS